MPSRISCHFKKWCSLVWLHLDHDFMQFWTLNWWRTYIFYHWLILIMEMTFVVSMAENLISVQFWVLFWYIFKDRKKNLSTFIFWYVLQYMLKWICSWFSTEKDKLKLFSWVWLFFHFGWFYPCKGLLLSVGQRISFHFNFV